LGTGEDRVTEVSRLSIPVLACPPDCPQPAIFLPHYEVARFMSFQVCCYLPAFLSFEKYLLKDLKISEKQLN
jgi:hypothetical protein